MRLYDRYTTQNVMEVDLGTCERGDPCAYDHTCRIHKVYGFLKAARMLAERSSVDEPVLFLWSRVPGAGWSPIHSRRLHNLTRIEVECGRLWLVEAVPCQWCAAANPRIRSSVTDHFIHTDTPVGRQVCTSGRTVRTLVGGDAGTSWHLTARPFEVPDVPELHLPGFPRECEFGRVD